MIAYISIKILEYKILQILVKLLFIGNYEQESQKILKLWLSHLFSGTKCTYFKRVVKVLVTQPCLTHCNPMDCSPPVSSIRGILQARILEWVAIRFPRGSSWPRDQSPISYIAGRFFSVEPLGKPIFNHVANTFLVINRTLPSYTILILYIISSWKVLNINVFRCWFFHHTLANNHVNNTHIHTYQYIHNYIYMHIYTYTYIHIYCVCYMYCLNQLLGRFIFCT